MTRFFDIVNAVIYDSDYARRGFFSTQDRGPLDAPELIPAGSTEHCDGYDEPFHTTRFTYRG